MSNYQPFTYLIGWSHLQKFYYGARYARGCSPKDLWTTYFTSSNYVSNFRKKYGEPNIIEVRKVFSIAEDAWDWERRVLERIEAKNNDHWLNQSNGGFKNFPKRSKPTSNPHIRLWPWKTKDGVFYIPEIRKIPKLSLVKRLKLYEEHAKMFTAEHKRIMRIGVRLEYPLGDGKRSRRGLRDTIF